MPPPITTTARGRAGDAAEQDAAAAVRALEGGAHLRRQPAGDLAHRREQRKQPSGAHRLVGDRRRAGLEEATVWAGRRRDGGR